MQKNSVQQQNKDIGAYFVRQTARAKNVSLRMNLHDGLIVTTPLGFSQRKIDKIISQKMDWIVDHQQKMQLKKTQLSISNSTGLPTKLLLHALDREVEIILRPTLINSVKYRLGGDSLILYGQIKDENACIKSLRKWVMAGAKDALVPWFDEYAEQLGFEYNGVRIRNQKSRWGSCCSSRNISLNAKLLFVPKRYVEYIFLHELCHLHEMNHSDRFWKLVQKHDPNYQIKDAFIRLDAWDKYVPQWL